MSAAAEAALPQQPPVSEATRRSADLQRVTAMLADANLVPREDFEVARAMAAKARDEQEALAAKVAALEARVAALEAGAKSRA